MPRGGKRAGAGRPKGSLDPETITKAQAREAHRILVMRYMEEMTKAQIMRALGTKYLVKRAKAGGKFEKVSAKDLEDALKGQEEGRLILEVWDELPFTQAYTDLMNRALDKPSEHLQLTGAEGGPVEVAIQSRLIAGRRRLRGEPAHVPESHDGESVR